ncbi:phospholipase D C [Calliphora vicina]|uniref:phospholipase D C n=1 Tax=Calliphora vicina TaxID=7373 RepID=UPI00325A5C39
MVENRKLFYAISLMLLTCCQIITMLPHNAASSESSSITIAATTSTNNSHNSENNNAEMLQHGNSNNGKHNNSNKNDSDFLIIVAERKQEQPTIVSSEGVWETQEENDSRPTDNIDDLIFLDKRPINQHHQHEKQMHHHHHAPHQLHQQQPNEPNHFEFHHITMVDGGSSNSNTQSNSDEDTDSLTDATYSTMIVVDEDADDDDDDDDGIPHEIELQPDINEEVTPLHVTPLDLSDFLSLIPATKVKTIVNHYYHNDPEVQRAHAFMSSRDFFMLKQHIIAVPEMSAFLRYLNNSGLDLVKFVTALTNLTSYEAANTVTTTNSTVDLNEATAAEAAITTAAASAIEQTTIISTENTVIYNNIEYAQKQSNKITPTISNIEIQITTSPPTTTTTTAWPAITMEGIETTTAKEQLNGLHGLVDSVLDVLPQDQILATFFDKLEANEQFSKLVDNIGSPEFAKVLNNMQNSVPLRNLIFTLHNNGIYVIRIVDSLKSYFFLGGF